MGSDPEKRKPNQEKYSQAIKDTAYKLRISGMSYPDIAKLLDVSYKRVYDWCADAVKKSVRESGRELRKIAEDRYDMLILHASELLHHSNPDVRLKANAQILRVEEARDRLLGLNEPEKYEVTVQTEEERTLREMIRRQRKLNEETLREMRGESDGTDVPGFEPDHDGRGEGSASDEPPPEGQVSDD